MRVVSKVSECVSKEGTPLQVLRLATVPPHHDLQDKPAIKSSGGQNQENNQGVRSPLSHQLMEILQRMKPFVDGQKSAIQQFISNLWLMR
ncbi:unnamed protein product [Trifolium pratense]|uniref:Uncharacterized protein n=1 Tax=Trifolium pratense TaxID=57577 RepID=A0ACB0JRB9_TRIPR|nr:unnamed protein product [Trifolium pratense]